MNHVNVDNMLFIIHVVFQKIHLVAFCPRILCSLFAIVSLENDVKRIIVYVEKH